MIYKTLDSPEKKTTKQQNRIASCGCMYECVLDLYD